MNERQPDEISAEDILKANHDAVTRTRSYLDRLKAAARNEASLLRGQECEGELFTAWELWQNG